MFLVEKLPKVTSAAEDGNERGTSFLIHEIAAKIEAGFSLPWLEPHCKTHGARWYGQSQTNWMREVSYDHQLLFWHCIFYSCVMTTHA